MNRFVFAALGLALAGSSASAQNLALPTSVVNASQPSADVVTGTVAPRLNEGRSVYDAHRLHHRRDQRR